MSLEEWLTKQGIGKYAIWLFKKWLATHQYNLEVSRSDSEWQELWERFVSNSMVRGPID